MRSFRASLLSSLVWASALGACGGEDAPTYEGDVVVQTFDTFDARGARTRVDDLFVGDVSVLLPTATGYDVYADTTITTGQILVTGVPSSSSYYLLYDRPNNAPLYQENMVRLLERGDENAHRQTTVAPADTFVRVSGTLARPWAASTSLTLFSDAANFDRTVFSNATVPLQSGGPNASDTSLTNFENELASMVDPYGLQATLVEGADDLIVLTSDLTSPNSALPVTHPFQALSIRSVSSAFDATGTVFTGGGTTSISGTFAVPTPKTVTFDLRTTRFTTALFAGGMGGAPAVYAYLNAYAEPEYDGRLLVGHAGALFETEEPASTMYAGNVPTYPPDFEQEITYANPYGAGRVEMAMVLVRLQYDRVDPASHTPESFVCDYLIYDRLSRVAGHAIVPTIGIPRNITVGGHAVPNGVAGDVTDVGLTPVIAWGAPSNGRVAKYRLELIDTADTAFSRWSTIARVETTARSFRVPEGLFVAGHRYVVRVTAETAKVDLGMRSTQAVTGYFVP